MRHTGYRTLALAFESILGPLLILEYPRVDDVNDGRKQLSKHVHV
jgi:hypothetical protein